MINENERQLEFTCRCGERFLLRFSVKPSERFEHFICPDCGTRQETRSRVLAAFRWNAFEELEAVPVTEVFDYCCGGSRKHMETARRKRGLRN